MGRDAQVHESISPRARFKSRALGGARRILAHVKELLEQFQFTRPRGARHGVHGAPGKDHVSIHAPTGGATEDSGREFGRRAVSIHAPGGATRFNFVEPMQRVISIHALAWGATVGVGPGTGLAEVSIHVPARVATR